MEADWKYCALIQDPASSRLFMLNLVNNQWVFAHEVKQLIEYEETNGQVS